MERSDAEQWEQELRARGRVKGEHILPRLPAPQRISRVRTAFPGSIPISLLCRASVKKLRLLERLSTMAGRRVEGDA